MEGVFYVYTHIDFIILNASIALYLKSKTSNILST